MVTLAVAQMNPVWEDRVRNYSAAAALVAQAAGQQADLLIFPEMFATGFSMNRESVVEQAPFSSRMFLSAQARLHQISIIGGYSRATADGQAENAADLFDHCGELVGSYVKCHVFSFSDEDKLHKGGTGPIIMNTDTLRIGLFICYDLRFPELFRKVADKMDLAVIIASWPGSRQLHWQTLLRARAIENQCFVAGVNRTGEGGGITYQGGSTVIDPQGAVVFDAGAESGLFTATINPDRVAETRRQFPFLKDRHFI